MALKGSRHEAIETNLYRMNETAEAGIGVWLSTGGSGIGLDSVAQLATGNGTPVSGTRFLGMLMCDVVNIDQTKQHINWHKDEVQQGSPVRILRDGWAVTNRIYPGVDPAAGDSAYISHSGFFTNSDPITDDTETDYHVGFFETSEDEDGYATIYVKLPN
jgi:hypothetical protein